MSMRKTYRKLAKKHGITASEIKREIQAAIDYAYQHTPNDGVTAAYQKQIPRKGTIPTADEVIDFAAKKAKQQSQ